MSSTSSAASSSCIGVFDSGVGGLSVLDALRRRLPHASLAYIGDVAHSPYGDRDVAEILDRCQRIVTRLVESGARVVVVACNTATVLCIGLLRERWPGVTFVGVEPGVKLGASVTRRGRMAVMVTPVTARSARLRHLIDEYASSAHVHVEPCPGLAAAVERGVRDGVELGELLAPHIARIRAADVDTVVLGCTHYPFVTASLQAMLGPDVVLVDTSDAVAERVAFVSAALNIGPRRLTVASVGSSKHLSALLEVCRHLEAVQVEELSI